MDQSEAPILDGLVDYRKHNRYGFTPPGHRQGRGADDRTGDTLDAVNGAVADGVERMVFGDLYLEDVRAYRVSALAGSGVTPLFPLWGRDTNHLARRVIELGIRAVVTCVDPRQVPASSRFRRRSPRPSRRRR